VGNIGACSSAAMPEFNSFEEVAELEVRQRPFILDFFAIFER
jgi:hypothetical protein